MSVKRDNETPTIPAILEDMARTATAMGMRSALHAIPDTSGNATWAATVGDLCETAGTPEEAYRKVLRRLAAVNEILGSKFSAQMDTARGRGAKEAR